MLPFTFRRPEEFDKLLGRLGDDPIAVVVEPIDERPDGGVFLVLHESRVIERPDEVTATLELLQEPLVVDVKAERFRRRIKVGAIDKEGDPLLAYHRLLSYSIRLRSVVNNRV